MFTRILIPLDGSSIAEAALPSAEEMARLKPTPIALIQVIDLNRLDHYGLEGLIGADGLADQLQVAEGKAKEYLDTIAHRLHNQGFSTTVATRCGDPATELLAATVPGDLVVMATHGRSGVKRALLGSVAEAVARRSTVPVLLVQANQVAEPSDIDAMTHLLHQDRYQPDELAKVLGMDEARIRQAALSGQLPAQILDHHVIFIARAGVLSWLNDGVRSA